MTTCTRTEPHPLGECANHLEQVAPAQVGDYVAIERRSKLGTEQHVVLVTSIEVREGYLYVGWRNAQPPSGQCHGRGWCPEAGQWGFFRQYPAEREFGTSILAVVR